jgi:HAD superfamily hydrolase (TIGR01509 family)
VILDESQQEAVRARLAVEILSTAVTGYSIGMYHDDIAEAVRTFCPSAYQFVFWKHLRHDRALFEKLFALYSRKWEERKPPLRTHEGIEYEVRALSAKYRVALAGQYGGEILGFLEECGILACFASQLTQDDFRITKPDPRYFERIARAVGSVPSECIMVGDRIDKDVVPAKQAGMKTILVRVGLHRHQQPRIPFDVPDAELPGVAGLAAAVDKIASCEGSAAPPSALRRGRFDI